MLELFVRICYTVSMNIQKWLDKNTSSLNGKVVAITGSTGGLGSALCWHLAKLGAISEEEYNRKKDELLNKN